MYSKELNSFIWPRDRTQMGTTTQYHSRPVSNGNEVVVYILQTPKHESLNQMVQYQIQDSHCWVFYFNADMDMASCTVPADWVIFNMNQFAHS